MQTLWLTPLTGPAQTVNFWSLGAPEKLFAQSDAFGNSVHSYTFVGEASDNVRWSLVNAAGQVETLGIAEFTDDASLPLPQLYLRATPLASPHPLLAEFGRRFVTQQEAGAKADLPALLALSAGVAGQYRW